MADNMKRRKAKSRRGISLSTSRFLGFWALCGLGLLPAAAIAAGEMLRDPTRPPAALYTGEEGMEIETGPVLQSVRKSNGRYTAVIGGETVRVGSKYGEARVVSIKETEVVLKTGNSLETLKLFPDVEKRPVAKNKRIKR